jgi:hypothetical protein
MRLGLGGSVIGSRRCGRRAFARSASSDRLVAMLSGLAGAALLELVRADAATVASGYMLTGSGLQKLP